MRRGCAWVQRYGMGMGVDVHSARCGILYLELICGCFCRNLPLGLGIFLEIQSLVRDFFQKVTHLAAHVLHLIIKALGSIFF